MGEFSLSLAKSHRLQSEEVPKNKVKTWFEFLQYAQHVSLIILVYVSSGFFNGNYEHLLIFPSFLKLSLLVLPHLLKKWRLGMTELESLLFSLGFIVFYVSLLLLSVFQLIRSCNCFSKLGIILSISLNISVWFFF